MSWVGDGIFQQIPQPLDSGFCVEDCLIVQGPLGVTPIGLGAWATVSPFFDSSIVVFGVPRLHFVMARGHFAGVYLNPASMP